MQPSSDGKSLVLPVSARRFWQVVVGSLLLTEFVRAAERTQQLADAAAQAAVPEVPPQSAELVAEQDIAVSTEPGHPAEVVGEQTQAAQLAQMIKDLESLPEASLSRLIRRWLESPDEPVQLAAAAPVAAGSPPSVSAEARARAAFRDLFNDELSSRGAPVIADNEADPAPAQRAGGFEFNPAMLLGLLGLGGGGGGGGAAALASAPTVAGVVVKGYLKGAIVWRDGDGNNRFTGTWTDKKLRRHGPG